MDRNIWINLKKIMIVLRSDIKNNNNVLVIKAVTDALEQKIDNAEMVCRLIKADDKWQQWLVSEHGADRNDGTKEIIRFIIVSLKYMVQYMENNEYGIAYDMADMIHICPDLQMYYNSKSLKKYWNIYVRPFVKKWKISIYDNMKVIFVPKAKMWLDL